MRVDKLKILNRKSISPVHCQFGENDEFNRYEIVPQDGLSNCCVHIYELPPSKASYPYHYHESNEEVFYIITGKGHILTEEGKQKIVEGDVIVCPPTPNGAHKIVNTSTSEPLVYIDFDTVSIPDVAHYPKTNTVGMIFADSNKNLFFKVGSKVDYEKDVEIDEE